MEIFSSEIAATLQYFTFPLEVIGLSLATIEVRFPTLAKRITTDITLAAQYVNEAERKANERRIQAQSEMSQFRGTIGRWFFSDKEPMTEFQYIFLRLWVPGIVILAILFIPLKFYLRSHNSLSLDYLHGLANVLDVALFFWLFGGLLVLFLELAKNNIVKFADKFVEGRAVGSLGIIVAGFGVLGEAYQFTTQLVV